MRGAVKEGALSMGGGSAFCLVYYFVITESKGIEGDGPIFKT